MEIDKIIQNIKNDLTDLTYFSFYVEKSYDDGGLTIDVYAIEDDIKKIRTELSVKYRELRLIFFGIDEEYILYLQEKNM